ncbi:ATP-binding protein [Leptospira idonii]|uniref:histidine kinase n=1 Tax=Leptospira idonii TaxID=1193500 RepID=A0A4R9LZ73_9LEPT|nr:ATP-binding protein [Leptospira idonii]TGN18921.1 GHKL domain-containing protein [Leptospira idonii]
MKIQVIFPFWIQYSLPVLLFFFTAFLYLSESSLAVVCGSGFLFFLSSVSILLQKKRTDSIQTLSSTEIPKTAPQEEERPTKRDELVQNLFALEKFKEELISFNDPDRISQTISQYLTAKIPAEFVRVYTWDEADGHFRPRPYPKEKDWNTEAAGLPVFDPFLLWLSDREGIHLKENFAEEKTINHSKIKESALAFFQKTDSVLVATLAMKSSLVGFILLGKNKKNKSYGLNEIEIILEILSVSLMSLSNSMIYQQLVHLTETLEAKVAERTRELEEAQTHLVQSEKMASLGVMVAGIAHEINTPAAVINGSSDNLEANLLYAFSHLSDLNILIQNQEIRNVYMNLLLTLTKEDTKEKIDPKDKFKLKKEVKQKLIAEGMGETESLDLSNFLIENAIPHLEKDLIRIRKDGGKEVYEMLRNSLSLHRNIKNIKYAIKNIVRIVKALKYYSHLGQASYADADLHEGLENTLVIMQNQIKQGVEIERQYSSLPLVRCNIDELNQVWTNLITNALHAMKKTDKPKLTIFTRAIGDNYVLVGFEDNGCGITTEIKDKIWDPFFTTKDQGEGTGLGLGIVKGIIEKHKGRIEVESQQGYTRFLVYLPLDGPGDVPSIPKEMIREIRG